MPAGSTSKKNGFIPRSRPSCVGPSPRLVDEIVWVKMTVNRRLAKSHGFYLQHAKEVCLVARKGEDPPGMRGGVGSDVIYRWAAACGREWSASVGGCGCRTEGSVWCTRQVGVQGWCHAQRPAVAGMLLVQRAAGAEPEAGGDLPTDRAAGAQR